MSDLYVAKTILEQIQCADRSALMAWGFCNPVGSDKETDLYECSDDGDLGQLLKKDFGCRGWVQFDVNGMKVKGRVYVGLNGMDLYDVYVMERTESLLGLPVFKQVGLPAEDVFCEDLMGTIDQMIERD